MNENKTAHELALEKARKSIAEMTKKELEKGNIIPNEENEPQKCPLDEVAAAYIATLRVENYADLGYEFGGYKIGAIYSYILQVLNDSINRLNNPQECITNAIFAEKVGK